MELAAVPGIEIEIRFMGGLRASLSHAIAQTADLAKPMAEIAAVLQEGVHDRFETETSPLGLPWVKSQRALKTGGKTLYDTGDLSHAIASESGADFAMVGVLPNPGLGHDNASVKDYAAIHQFGGTIKHPGGTAYHAPKGKRAKFIDNVKAAAFHPRTAAHDIVMPARPYLGFGEFERAETEDILQRHFASMFSGSGHE